jgi:hypothetical protein
MNSVQRCHAFTWCVGTCEAWVEETSPGSGVLTIGEMSPVEPVNDLLCFRGIVK